MGQFLAHHGRVHRRLFPGPVGDGDGTAEDVRGAGWGGGGGDLLGGGVECVGQEGEGVEWWVELQDCVKGEDGLGDG